jgi:hypothetical protein
VSDVGRTFEFLAGAFLVVAAVLSAIRGTILPRGAQSRISNLVIQSVRWVFRLRARRRSTFEGRDRALAMLGPVALLVLLGTWLLMIMAGYTLMYLAITDRTLAKAFELSGSSVFTLGTTSDSHFGALFLSYTEAGLGLLILALLITYLPSIYGAFSRRENGVALLQVRAGRPPRATALLIRYQRIEESRFRLTELWQQWEAWFTDVEETHTTFPILVFFRSPQPDRSWITAAGALLDAASFWAGAVEHPRDPDAQLCIRAGYLALRRIAESFHVAFDSDPAPDDPISVERSEWDEAMAELEAAGVPVVADREKAWSAWRGWRVNYDTVLLNMARLVDAPMAPWISDRSPVGPDLRWSLRRKVSGVSADLRRRARAARNGETPAS